MADARLDLSSVAPGRGHAIMGTTSGESAVAEALTAQIIAEGFAGQDPALLTQLPANRLANAVSEELGLCGESLTIATACSASNYAIGYAYDLLAGGEADVVFAGGADSVCRWAHAGFFRLGALAKDACTPFDKDRAGILTGEGGAVLALETLEHAQKRGARIYAELLGYGVNCDAIHPVTPDAPTVAECMRIAHRNSGVAASDVDYICAHGTGTQVNDLVESKAVVEVFGERPPPISSIKSMLGHTMGAACGFGAIASTVAIDRGFLPPTVNWTTADPELGVDPVPNEARPARVKVVAERRFRLRWQQRHRDVGSARMSGVVVTGWSALTSAGVGVDALAKKLALAEAGQVAKGPEIGDLYEEPLPATTAHVLNDFTSAQSTGAQGNQHLRPGDRPGRGLLPGGLA